MTDTVLLVEDNPGDARLIEEMFNEVDREASASPTGGEGRREVRHVTTLSDARQYLSENESSVDVVLLDLMLPDGKGMESVETILEATDRIPVIVLTGMAEAAVGVTAVKHGAQDYLVKDDVTAQVLVRSIEYAKERKRTEHQLRRRTEELAILNQLTRHDIRNDISLVVGRARELAEHVEPRGQSLLTEILESSNHVLQLTRTIGDVVETVAGDEQAVGGEEQTELHDVDLITVLETEVETAQQLYRSADIELERETFELERERSDFEGEESNIEEEATDLEEETTDLKVRANGLLSSVVGNLLSNAIRYNDQETPTVRVSVETDEETVTVCVADDGPGIPERQKDRIFGRGVSGEESSGMGIGLTLVDRLVEGYGGEVWIEDNEPRGSVFCVSLSRA